MIIGFTGTRRGLTPPQRAALDAEVMAHPDARWVHGGALGADMELDCTLATLGRPTDIYPARKMARPRVGLRRFRNRDSSWLIVHGGPYEPLQRNRIIVKLCDRLVACPAEPVEQQRGGTWYTIRTTRAAGKPILIILPDGTTREESQNNALLTCQLGL